MNVRIDRSITLIAIARQGDAAMADGDYNGAVELFSAAKVRRDEMWRGATLASAAEEHLMGREVSSSRGSNASVDMMSEGQKSQPRHGRRASTERVSELATPSRRHQAEGAPTRKEEVAARVAARYQ
jgi:hypothetical protein